MLRKILFEFCCNCIYKCLDLCIKIKFISIEYEIEDLYEVVIV